jgi:hypothetical protein
MDTVWRFGANMATTLHTDVDFTLGELAILTSRALAEPEGSLSIYLVPNAPQPQSGYAELGGTLRIKWGSTELGTTWRVAP